MKELDKKSCVDSQIFQDFLAQKSYLLNEPIMKLYLKKEENLKLLAKAVCFPADENITQLDNQFKQFYYHARFIKYLSTLICNYSIDLEKRYKRYYQRHSLILDKPDQYNEKSTMLELYYTYDPKMDELFLKEDSILEYIENPKLYKALKTLSSKQLKILHLFYVKGLNNKLIAQYFGDSPQNISKLHHKSISLLKKQLQKGS